MTDEAKIGRMIERPVVEITDQGAYCDCGEYGELFVPRSQLPRYLKEGDELRLFLYKDAGRVLATARHPYLELGMTGRLRVASIDCGTAYLDLGIPKELVVPVSEQRTEFEVGESVLVYVAIDDQGKPFEPSPDPLLAEAQAYVKDVKLGETPDCSKLEGLLRNKTVFGVDLVEAGLADKVCRYFEELTAAPGAVRATLHKYVTEE